jgi:O-antigen/teichoic acid export membrane protein
MTLAERVRAMRVTPIQPGPPNLCRIGLFLYWTATVSSFSLKQIKNQKMSSPRMRDDHLWPPRGVTAIWNRSHWCFDPRPDRHPRPPGQSLVTSSVNALSSVRALMSGILWNGFGRVLPIAAAMAATPFLLHKLGVDRWALFTLALSITGSFGILDFGVSAALTRALAERIGTPAEDDAAPLVVTALVILALIGCTGAGVGFVFTPMVVDHLLTVPPDLRSETIGAFRLLAASAPLIVINSVFWGVLAAYQKWRAATLLNTPVSVMYYLGPVLALLTQNSLIWIAGTLVAVRSVQVLIHGALSVQLLPGLLRRRIDLRQLRPLLQIGAWITLTNTLWPVMVFLDRFIVGAVLSLSAVSYFSTPVDLVSRLGIVPGAVAAAVFPAIAVSHRSSPDRVNQLLRTGSLAVITVILPACLLLAGLSNEMLTFWLGASFAADSSQVLGILAIGIFLSSIAVLPSTLTDAIGRPKVGAVIMLGTTIVFLPTVVLMCSHYGVIGAALAWTLRSLFYFVARLLLCGKLSGSVSPVISKLFAISLTGSAGLTACMLVGPLPARLMIIGLTFGSAMPMAVVMLLKKAERNQLRERIERLLAGPALARRARGAYG